MCSYHVTFLAYRMQVHVDPKIHFDDPRLLEHLRAGGTQAALIHEFLIVLSVCHTVIPELVRMALLLWGFFGFWAIACVTSSCVPEHCVSNVIESSSPSLFHSMLPFLKQSSYQLLLSPSFCL